MNIHNYPQKSGAEKRGKKVLWPTSIWLKISQNFIAIVENCAEIHCVVTKLDSQKIRWPGFPWTMPSLFCGSSTPWRWMRCRASFDAQPLRVQRWWSRPGSVSNATDGLKKTYWPPM
jgi:hypothetical protein